jgi:hypothetical protein
MNKQFKKDLKQAKRVFISAVLTRGGMSDPFYFKVSKSEVLLALSFDPTVEVDYRIDEFFDLYIH